MAGIGYNSFNPSAQRANTSTYIPQSYSRTTLTKTKRKRGGYRSNFKNKVLSLQSAKHDTGEQSVTMTHNTLSTLNLTSRIVQGTTNASRDGDAIVLCGLKLKGYYLSDIASNAYGFRILIGYSGEEYSNATFAAGLGLSEIFLPSTGSTSTTIGQINPKTFTIIHDELITANSQIAAIRERVDYDFYVDLKNSKFPYQSAASALGKYKNLYCVIVSEAYGGATGTTASGVTVLSWDHVFKNA